MFDEQLDVRDLLRGQDEVEWVIISNGIFISFLFEPAFGVVDLAAGTVRALGGWDNSVTATTPEDIGRLATEILFAEPRIVNQVVHVAGDTVTYGQIAGIVDRQLGREVERVLWGVPRLQIESARDPGDAMKKYRAVFAMGPGITWDMATTFNHRRCESAVVSTLVSAATHSIPALSLDPISALIDSYVAREIFGALCTSPAPSPEAP